MSLITSSTFRVRKNTIPVRVYRHPIGASERNAIFVGFIGSLIYGLLLQVPVRLMFEALITSTPSITESHVRLGYGVILILPFAGLFFTILLLRQRWTPRNLNEQLSAIIGISLVFGLVFNILVSSPAFGLLASRDMWSFYHTLPDTASVAFQEFIASSVYRVTTEAGALSLLHMTLTLLGGVAMGLLLVPIERRKSHPVDTRNAFLPMLAVILPIVLLLIFVVSVVVNALLAPATAQLFSDDARRTLAEFLIQVGQWGPILIALLIVQVGLLIALLRTHVLTLHRRATRLSQVMYGLVFGVGQVWFLNMTNPAYVGSSPGSWMVLLSMILALAWLLVAQVKLRREQQVQYKQIIQLTFGRYLTMLASVGVIVWLMMDLFMLRTTLNLIQIVVASIPSEGNHITLSSVDVMLSTAIHHGAVTSLTLLVITVIVVCVMFTPIIVMFRLLEHFKNTA